VRLTGGRRVLLQPSFLGLLATNFVLGLTSAFILPFVSLWATRDIGMSSFGLGVFMTLNGLAAIGVSTWIARGSDSHFSRRALLMLGAAAGVLGNLAYAHVRNAYALTLIGSTLLALATINFAQLFAHVREELGRESGDADVPFSMGVLRACYALAWTVGPPSSALILGRFGYPGIFLATAALYLIFLGCVHRFVKRRPRAAPSEPRVQTGPSWGLGQPWLLAHAVAFALMFAAFTLKGLNLPLFLTEQLGGTERGVGAAFAISPVFEMAFMLWFGHIAAKGRRQERGVILLGALAAVVYFAALSCVEAAWQVYPLQVLNAVAVAVTTSVAIPFFQDLMPRQPGAATSLYSNALRVGSLVGFISFGALAGSSGHTGLFLLCSGLSAVTLGILLVAGSRSTRAFE